MSRCIDADKIPYVQAITDTFEPSGKFYARREDIAAMPTIEPERKRGKWIPDYSNNYEERFICSVCGKNYKVDTCMGKPMWDFCPCGADMRGYQDE